jgi:hypothetical protein
MLIGNTPYSIFFCEICFKRVFEKHSMRSSHFEMNVDAESTSILVDFAGRLLKATFLCGEHGF